MKKNGIKFGLSIVFEFIIFAAAALGVIIQLGVFEGEINLLTLNYYTVLSNILCSLFALFKVIAKLKNRRNPHYQFLKRARGSVVLCIIVTGLVYHFMLSGAFSMSGDISSLMSLANYILHYFVPAAILLDWLIFDEKGSYRAIEPVLWLIIPIAYLIYSMVCGAMKLHYFMGSSYYPYFFLDVDAIGAVGVLGYVGALIGIFLILGYVLYFIDRALGKKNRHRYN